MRTVPDNKTIRTRPPGLIRISGEMAALYTGDGPRPGKGAGYKEELEVIIITEMEGKEKHCFEEMLD